jgi:hypothetical protein
LDRRWASAAGAGVGRHTSLFLGLSTPLTHQHHTVRDAAVIAAFGITPMVSPASRHG